MSHSRDEWKRIVEAVEAAVPLYESISEAISFGLAGPLRRRAVASLERSREGWTLDLGAGPGVSSGLLLSRGFRNVVGVDPSRTLLDFAKGKLGNDVHSVVGVAESLPFKSEVFEAVLTCFALRDVRDFVQSLREVSRVSKTAAGLGIVDIGKPRGLFQKNLVWFYIKFGMPVVARLLIRGRIRGNPFRMIIPTFKHLLTNDELQALVRREFGLSKLREYTFGGLVILEAKKEVSTRR